MQTFGDKACHSERERRISSFGEPDSSLSLRMTANTPVWITDVMTGRSTPHRGKASKQLWGVQAEAARYNEEQKQTILTLKGGTLMLLEADLIVKRAALRWLTERHPSW